MTSLDNILSFISLRGISVREFEQKTGIANGTVNNSKQRNADLTSKNIEKIAKAYKAELEEAGFYVVDLKAFGREGYAIVKKNELPDEGGIDEHIERPNIEYLSKALADQAEANKLQAEANKKNAEAINRLASAIEKMSVSFGTILSTQDAGFGLVAELVNRQVRNDANGNQEKVKHDLDEIAQRIGPGLGSIAKKGIGADGHNEGMGNP